MNLSQVSSLYIAEKRTNGRAYEDAESALARFSRFIGDVELDQITTLNIESYLNRRPLANRTWRAQYFFLARFFEFWSLRDNTPELVMPFSKPKLPFAFIPHIYSKQDLQTLLKTKVPRHRDFVLHDRTLRTLLLFLYATGARLTEALNLTFADVNLAQKRVTFAETGRSVRSRTVPIGRDLAEILRLFIRWRAKLPGDRLFVTNDGNPLKDTTAHEFFVRLCHHAGVYWRGGDHRPPWLSHLRNTFAIHRITAWIRNGADLNTMLPALAAYMGYRRLESTEQFFLMTPDRFRPQLRKLGRAHGGRHWRNDKQLMNFLNGL
jgi:integrase/recombinase XerD